MPSIRERGVYSNIERAAMPRMALSYDGRVGAVAGVSFQLVGEQRWFHVKPSQVAQVPKVGQFVYLQVGPSGLVTAMYVRTPLRDRIVRSHERTV